MSNKGFVFELKNENGQLKKETGECTNTDDIRIRRWSTEGLQGLTCLGEVGGLRKFKTKMTYHKKLSL